MLDVDAKDVLELAATEDQRPVVDEEPHSPVTIVELHQQVARLLQHPAGVRLAGAGEVLDASAADRDEGEHVQAAQPDGVDGLGRAGARCRRCRRPVSPARPPNRACQFLGTRLSTGLRRPFSGGWSGTSDRDPLVVRVCPRVAPRRGNAVTPVAVAGYRDLGGPGEPRAVDTAPCALPVPPLDLFPGQTRVLLAQPAHHSPPQVVAEVGEAALTRAVTVVVGPAP